MPRSWKTLWGLSPRRQARKEKQVLSWRALRLGESIG
jgi:hypothetical protein